MVLRDSVLSALRFCDVSRHRILEHRACAPLMGRNRTKGCGSKGIILLRSTKADWRQHCIANAPFIQATNGVETSMNSSGVGISGITDIRRYTPPAWRPTARQGVPSRQPAQAAPSQVTRLHTKPTCESPHLLQSGAFRVRSGLAMPMRRTSPMPARRPLYRNQGPPTHPGLPR